MSKAKHSTIRYRLTPSSMETIDRKSMYYSVYNSAKEYLNKAKDVGELVTGLKALEEKNHHPIQKFLRYVRPYTSSYDMHQDERSVFLWTHLRTICILGIALDDPITIELLHEHLDEELFQDLISNVFLAVLGLDAAKVLDCLIKMSEGKNVWSNKLDSMLCLPRFANTNQFFMQDVQFKLSCNTLLTYLKYLEKHPSSAENIRCLFEDMGVCDLPMSEGDERPLVLRKPFYKLDYAIQILLLKLARDNKVSYHRGDHAPQDDVPTDDIFKLAKMFSKVTQNITLLFSDMWRLVKCVEDLMPNLKKAGAITPFTTGSYLLLPIETRQAWDTQSIAKRNHIKCKGIAAIIEYTAATALAQNIEWAYPVEAEPATQIRFLNKIFHAITKDIVILRVHSTLS